MNQNPIFIGGCGRSGTSMLLSLLSVLPNVYSIPYETKAFSHDGYPGGKGKYTGELRIDFIHSHLIEPEVVIEDYERWCEKTPKNIRFVPRILEYFGGGTRFIHIVRDGRDVVTSRHSEQPDQYWVRPERWVSDVRAGRVFEDHPQVATVRYEDLTTDPMPELRRLCRFLGEPFDEKRFRAYPESAQFGVGDFFSKDVSKGKTPVEKNERLHTRSQNRWEKDEHAPIIEKLLALDGAQELLQYYGYLNHEKRRALDSADS